MQQARGGVAQVVKAATDLDDQIRHRVLSLAGR
jgi:hypothetical protein